MSAGLLHSAQSLLAGLVALGRTRLELFGVELREELTRLVYVLLGAVAALLFAALGAALAAAALLLALPAEARIGAALGLAALSGVGALAAALLAQRLLRGKPRPLEASIAELERDREALQP